MLDKSSDMFRASLALLLVPGLSSSNYGAAVLMWTKVQLKSLGYLLKLKPKVPDLILFGFPRSPLASHWMKPLTLLYCVLLFPPFHPSSHLLDWVLAFRCGILDGILYMLPV